MSGKHGRRKHHEEHEEHVNHEAWVIPYADMLTLLMGLFLVMWALGNQDLAKMKAVSTGFAKEIGIAQPGGGGKGGAGLLEGGPSAKPQVAPELSPERVAAGQKALERQEQAAEAKQAAGRSLDRTEAVIKDRVAQAGVGQAVSMRREERGLIVSILSDEVLFAPGSASLEADGRTVLDGVAGALAAVDNPIAIEGHSDPLPISTGIFPSNWELSTARAATVLRYLHDRHGIAASRLQAAGFGDQRPLADNSTTEGRARNRRVDIAVLSTVDTTMTTDAATGGEEPR